MGLNSPATNTLDAETSFCQYVSFKDSFAVVLSNTAQVRTVLLLSFLKLQWVLIGHRSLWLQGVGKCYELVLGWWL